MTKLVELLAEHGGLLLVGPTLLLGLGVLGVSLARAAVHRQRLGELAVAATLFWLVLAWVPLPRPEAAGLGWWVKIDWAQPRPMPAAAQQPVPPVAEGHVADAPLSERQDLPVELSHGPTPSRTVVSEDRFRWVDPSTTPSVRHSAWPTVVVIAYLTGVAGCVLWLAIGQVLLIRAGRAAAAPEPWLTSVYQSLPHGGGPRRARLLVSRRCRRPVVYGLWRPKIVLPAELCRPEKVRQLRHALLHELAHVWRGDAWGHLLFDLACPLLYFHPFYWWLRGRVQFARELIADDWAARFGTKESYVEELVELVKTAPRLVPGSPGVLGAFRIHTQFYRRMQMLIDRKQPLETRPSKTWRFAALLGCGVILAAAIWLLGLPPANADADTAAAESAANDEPSDKASEPILDDGAEKAPDVTKGGGIEILGLVELIDSLEVAARTEGQLVTVTVREGMQVKRGQMLAGVDEEDAKIQFHAAKAAMDGLRTHQLSLREAQLEAENAKKDLERLKSMAAKALVSDADLSRAELAVQRAELRIEMAMAELKSAQRVREASLLAAERNLERCRVSAPLDGIVVQVYRKAGEWVKPGDPICRIVRLDRLRVEGQLALNAHDPKDVEGCNVIVEAAHARAKGERVAGKVTFVSPLVDSGRFFRFWAEFDNPRRNGHWLLRPGLHAKVIVNAD